MTTSFRDKHVNVNPIEGYDTSPEIIPRRKKLLVRARKMRIHQRTMLTPNQRLLLVDMA
jgi:hypothetical protein